VACLLIVTGAVILVDHALSPALPGQASSGSVTSPRTADRGATGRGRDLEQRRRRGVPALQLYNKVLSEDPDDPDALAASGWLEWNAGNAGKSAASSQAGRQAEEKAMRVAPTYYGGHLYLG
jgi:hypothetical protein